MSENRPPVFWRALTHLRTVAPYVATDMIEQAGVAFVSLVNLDTSVVHLVRPEEFWQTFEIAQAKPDSNEAAKFWSGVYAPDGMKAEQVKAELSDYRFMLEQVPKVYEHVTGGKLSKPNYFASVVIAEADDEVTRLCEEEIKGALEEQLQGELAALVGRPLHPRTQDLVWRFAIALGRKLAEAEQKYGYSDGWARADWMDECRQQLMHHIAKGDPRDVAAYCAFLWHHGASTQAPHQGQGVKA
jgi:hypothetical protein